VDNATDILKQILKDIPEDGFEYDPDQYWRICPFCHVGYEEGLGGHIPKPTHDENCSWLRAKKYIEAGV